MAKYGYLRYVYHFFLRLTHLLPYCLFDCCLVFFFQCLEVIVAAFGTQLEVLLDIWLLKKPLLGSVSKSWLAWKEKQRIYWVRNRMIFRSAFESQDKVSFEVAYGTKSLQILQVSQTISSSCSTFYKVTKSKTRIL